MVEFWKDGIMKLKLYEMMEWWNVDDDDDVDDFDEGDDVNGMALWQYWLFLV